MRLSFDREVGDLQQRILDIAIVEQDISSDRCALVFGAITTVILSVRRIIDRRKADIKFNWVGQRDTVGAIDGHFIQGAIPIGDRREGVTSVRIDRQSTLSSDEDRVASSVGCGVAGDREAVDEDVVAFHVEGIMQDVTRKTEVFCAHGRGRLQDRTIIN